MNQNNVKPLDGMRVIEMGQLIAGPFTGSVLAYYGAEVIKIDLPNGGEIRRTPPFYKDDPSLENGAFHIALENKVPILPVVIAGTGDIWPRGRKFLSSGKAMIKTLEPIDMTNYTKDTIDQLTKDTHKKMKKVY